MNTLNSQNIWWFCFPASGLRIKDYIWSIPQVQKVKKKMQLPTGLNLQPGRLITLSAKCSQTWPFRAKCLSGYEQQQQSLPIKHILVRFCMILFYFFLTYRFQKEERSIFPALKNAKLKSKIFNCRLKKVGLLPNLDEKLTVLPKERFPYPFLHSHIHVTAQ